jgi:hypothetical protein
MRLLQGVVETDEQGRTTLRFDAGAGREFNGAVLPREGEALLDPATGTVYLAPVWPKTIEVKFGYSLDPEPR